MDRRVNGPVSESGVAAKEAGSRRRVKRCTFTLPESDEALIDHIQELADRMGRQTPSRSEVVRAALKHLAWSNERKLREAFGSLERIKTGRPPKT